MYSDILASSIVLATIISNKYYKYIIYIYNLNKYHKYIIYTLYFLKTKQ